MVEQEILEALKSAIARGESLKRAMMTLYNAGYKKEEISEAAQTINAQGIQSQAQPQVQPFQPQQIQPAQPQTSQPTTYISQQPANQSVQQIPPLQQTPQRVSSYGAPPSQGNKIIIILLGFLLLILIGILVTVFLFKDELLNFFNNVFT